MNSAGNHGGSAPGETSPALVFLSPKLQELGGGGGGGAECPARPREGTEFEFFDKVEQSDLVPTLAALLGTPVPRNNLGILIAPLLGFWSEKERVQLLYRNALQVLGVVKATFGDEAFVDAERVRTNCGGLDEGREELACRWDRVRAVVHPDWDTSAIETATEELSEFLRAAQETLSSTASNYNVSRLLLAIAVAACAAISALVSFPILWPPSTTGFLYGVVLVLYGMMMFASSYVEEEQHFWYWTTSAWFLVLYAKSAHTDLKTNAYGPHYMFFSAALLLALHRLAIRWNQTGQKHAGEPDVAHTFFLTHHIVLWILIIATYSHLSLRLARHTFAGILPINISAIAAVTLGVSAFVFKLNFTQADAPELVQGLARQIRGWSAPFDLVLQARIVFVGLGIAATLVAVVSGAVNRHSGRRSGEQCTKTVSKSGNADTSAVLTDLPKRLHNLLTLLLITQTRAQNVPLFLIYELQLRLLALLHLAPHRSSSVSSTQNRKAESLTRSVSILLLTHSSFYAMGGSNAISSIDLSNAYNGVSGYNILAVGVLLFLSNWAGPIWWASAGVQLLLGYGDTSVFSSILNGRVESGKDRKWVQDERERLHETIRYERNGAANKTGTPIRPPSMASPWLQHISCMTVFMALSLLMVMASCTALRTHLFIWTVFSPKYLYTMAWCIVWHLGVNIGLGGLLYWTGVE
ncbi:major facilitator superfamily transporter protein [Elasticomyces elasticus]|nr:major facilitator superfamily transporter protein [Elasticomyces elasticus]